MKIELHYAPDAQKELDNPKAAREQVERILDAGDRILDGRSNYLRVLLPSQSGN